jgi:uncharacterized protein (TIGR00369 family)
MPLTDEQLVERFSARRMPTGEVFNAEILEIRSAEGFVRIGYVIGPQFCNPMGNVQGGIVTAMMDDCAAIACIVKAGKPIYVPTLELKTTFLAPAKRGPLFAEARCIKLGKTIGFMEAELKDKDGNILAKMSTTCAPRMLDIKPNFASAAAA